MSILKGIRSILYSPEIASVVGRTSATILNQIDYWTNTKSGRIIDGIRWFYKTYKEWAYELQISISTVRRAIAHLKETGIILTQVASYRFRRSQRGHLSNKIPSRVKIGGIYAERNNCDLCYH